MVIKENIEIHPPLAGEWRFIRPPGHHPFAFDFVQLDEKRRSTHNQNHIRFFISHIPSNKFYCWNKPVFSPVDGTVIRVGDGWQDHLATNLWQTIRLWYDATFKFRPQEQDGRLDIRPNAGNHVMIEASEGYIVFLAHLRNRTISVREGEQVRRGDPIAMVGNSGNSTMPHLHINIFDQMENPFAARVLPFVFTQFEILDGNSQWIENRRSLPKKGSFVRFQV